MIDPKKMTEKTQEAFITAQQAAQENGRSQLDVEELFAALLAQQGGIVPSVMSTDSPTANPDPVTETTPDGSALTVCCETGFR